MKINEIIELKQKHRTIHSLREKEFVIHSECKKAIILKDGQGYYYYHGKPVPRDVSRWRAIYGNNRS